MSIQNQRRILENALTPLPRIRSDYEELGRLFTGTYFEEFDRLSLQEQKLRVMSLKAKCELYSERFEKNCGPGGGRPPKWSDEEIADVQQRIAVIIASSEYRNKKTPKNAGILAYEILAESLLSWPGAVEFLKSKGQLNSNKKPKRDVIKKVARAIKERVRARTKIIST
jgi:hypothetical protein